MFREIDWSRPGEEAIKDFKKGEVIKVKVLDIDLEKERISLGIKQLSEDPFQSATTELKRGDIVTCTVSAVTDGGIEVSTSGGAQGVGQATTRSVVISMVLILMFNFIFAMVLFRMRLIQALNSGSELPRNVAIPREASKQVC